MLDDVLETKKNYTYYTDQGAQEFPLRQVIPLYLTSSTWIVLHSQ